MREIGVQGGRWTTRRRSGTCAECVLGGAAPPFRVGQAAPRRVATPHPHARQTPRRALPANYRSAVRSGGRLRPCATGLSKARTPPITRVMRLRCSFLPALVACVLAGCGAASTKQTTAPAAQPTTATPPTVVVQTQTATPAPAKRANASHRHQRGPAVTQPAPGSSLSLTNAASICDWTANNPAYRNHTTPGSYTDHGPGSCPTADLTAVVGLVSRFRQAVLGGGNVCALLPPNYRWNEQRAATEGHTSCSKAAIRGVTTAAEVAQPLAQIRLLSTTAAPAPAAGFVIFRPNPHRTGDLGGNPLWLAISKHAGGWQLDQIGYQP